MSITNRFSITSNNLSTTTLIIGYYPQHITRAEDHYLNISELQIDWWGSYNALAQINYGVWYEGEDAWKELEYFLHNTADDIPMTLYDSSNKYKASVNTHLFQTIFYPPALLFNNTENAVQAGTTRGPWSFKASDGLYLTVDISHWLYFFFEGEDRGMELSVKIAGTEERTESTRIDITKFSNFYKRR